GRITIGVVDSAPTQPSRFSQRFWRFSLRALGTTSLFLLTVRGDQQRCRPDSRESLRRTDDAGTRAGALRRLGSLFRDRARSTSYGCLLRNDAQKQQCLVVLLHAMAFDFSHDQLP